MTSAHDGSRAGRAVVRASKGLPVARTPLQFEARLSADVGVDLWIKREDLQDEIGSGVKRRSIAATLAHRCDTRQSPIVIDGVPQSNCLMSMAHYCGRDGIPLHVILRGALPAEAEGNYAALLGSGANLLHVRDPSGFDAARDTLVSDLVRQGKSPLVVPAGASAPFSILGPLGLGLEIAEQENGSNVAFDAVALPVGTGGTLVGLLLSERFHRSRPRLLGVRIDEYPLSAYHRKLRLCSAALDKMMGDGPYDVTALPPLQLYDDALGGGYGRFSPEDVRESRRLLDLTGLIFGPTYMLKAVQGLRRMLAEGLLSRSSKVLLVHTGGVNERVALST